MKKRIAIPGFFLALTAVIACCNEQNNGTGNAIIGVTAQALLEEDVEKIVVTASGPGIIPPMVVQLLGNSADGWYGTVENIPAGRGISFKAEAFNLDNGLIYSGNATDIEIIAQSTIQVNILLQPEEPPDPYANSVPRFEAIVLSASQVAPSHSVDIKVQAVDPDGDSLIYLWSAESGSFGDRAKPATFWNAPESEGISHLTIAATDQQDATATISFPIEVGNAYGDGNALVTIDINHWPTITKLTASPTRIDVGQTTELKLKVNDPDGHSLSYSWSADCGEGFDDPNTKDPQFTLLSDFSGRDCVLRVVVNDNNGGSNRASIEITTGPPLEPSIDTDPETFENDECATGEHDCVDAAEGGVCTDTHQGYECSCQSGYDGDGTLSGTRCRDRNECANEEDDCVDEENGGICTNLPGGYACSCESGYVGDGTAEGTGCSCRPNTSNRCGEDGNVYFFDSCGNQGDLVEQCPAENAECVELSNTVAECRCQTHWTGENCDVCPINWDAEQDCNVCASHWDPALNCSVCEEGWGGESCDIPCVVHVNGQAEPGGDGNSWDTAMDSVQDGIDAAYAKVMTDPNSASCEVWVAADNYNIYLSSATNTIELRPHVLLFGGFAGNETAREQRDWKANETILDGNGQVDHVVTGSDDAAIDGFTVTRGRTGMYNFIKSPRVRNCVFHGNTGGHGNNGAGMYNYQNTVLVKDCVFVENTIVTGNGAGMYNYESNVEIDNCVFRGNSTSNGGAISNNSGEMSVTDSIFLHNTATGTYRYAGGGGIMNGTGKILLSGCVFSDNTTVSNGGAIYTSGGNLKVEHTVFNNNTSSSNGGGIYGNNLTVASSVFTGNTANSGGGILSSSSPSMHNTVFAGNRATSNGGAMYSSGTNSFTNCTFAGNTAEQAGDGVYCDSNSRVQMTNSVLFFNGEEDLYNHTTSVTTIAYSAVDDVEFIGNGNTQEAPLFLGYPSETGSAWTNVFYETETLQTILTNSAASWAPGALQGLFVKPTADDDRWLYIVDNSSTQIRVWGDQTDFVASGNPYEIFDLHLRSGSPCIDAAKGTVQGNDFFPPSSDIEGNSRVDDSASEPNKGIGTPDYVDMGAYEYQP